MSYEQLIRRSQAVPYRFPIESNRLKNIIKPPFNYPPENIAMHAMGVRPIVHEKVVELAESFLAFKRIHGSDAEKRLYDAMALPAFFDKLIRKRPLMFMTARDEYILRDGKTEGAGGFEAIGTELEEQPLILTEYNSYGEMQIAALMGVSVPTYFINSGSRNNEGIVGLPGSFEEYGIYTALVGARFERQGSMEWQHMIVSPEQNTSDNGYGLHADPDALETRSLAFWANFYGEGDFFPDYQTAVNDGTGKFIRPNKFASYFLNRSAYKQRIRMIAEPFLIDANERAAKQSRQAYVIAVGYGIGVWAIPGLKDEQARLIVEAFEDVLAENHLPFISDLVFSWYPESCMHCGGVGDGEMLKVGSNEIRIHFNKNSPAEKLTGSDEGKLLVASYAWDGNAYPGNEYWAGADFLSASGDPAAASCSTISELQNPDVNPALCGERTHVAHTGVEELIVVGQ